MTSRERGPQDGATGIAVGSQSPTGVDVAITVPAGGVDCQVPVFGGLVATVPDRVEAQIQRFSAPRVLGEHCLSTGHPVVFNLLLSPRPEPYLLVLKDTVSCQPTCGGLSVRVEP